MKTIADQEYAKDEKPLVRHTIAVVGLLGVLLLALLDGGAAHAQSGSETSVEKQSGYTYTVQRGDSWGTVAQENGVSVTALKDANPNAVRDTDWLIVGDELTIPAEQSKPKKTYTVKAGESWNSIAETLDIPVSELKAANPRSIRTNEVLFLGEKLTVPASEEVQLIDESGAAASEESGEADIAADETVDDGADDDKTEDVESTAADADAEPTPVPAEEATEDGGVDIPADEDAVDASTADESETSAGISYAVQPGESWNSIARALGVTAEELQESNPQLIRPGLVLFRGDILNIPATTVSDKESNAADADDSTGATSDDTNDDAVVATTNAEKSSTTGTIVLPECPVDFGAYPGVLTELVNLPNATVDDVDGFLTACNAGLADSLIATDLTGDEAEELVVAYINPDSDAASLESDLLIYNGSEDGYTLEYRANAAGEVRILSTEDINDDELTDVVWIDTTCGSSTCFDTVMVYSWDGSAWTSWTDGNITMAYADIALVDESDAGSGRELVLDGGVYGSVGAGPQRSRTEVWGSVEGAPYTLLTTAFAESNCLYHVVLDANNALLNAEETGLDEAEALYTEAVGNEDLVKCWVRDSEMDELRSFSYFRLALIAAYQGRPDVVSDLLGALAAVFPNSVYVEVGDIWLSAYEETDDVAQACEATLSYVQDAPEAALLLSDYGYANPEFTAADVCPTLDIEVPVVEVEDAVDIVDADAQDASSPDEEVKSDEDEIDVATPEAEDESGSGASATSGRTEDAPAISAALAVCPDNIDRFATALEELLNDDADQTTIEDWLTTCDALAEDRGGLVMADLNGDNVDDVLAMPTIISDLGYGPGGSQGAVLAFHGDEDGSYSLAFEPDVIGEPRLLALDDVNNDGQIEFAWTIESCSTFCVLEVQMVTWDGSDYVTAIEPGAIIAEGSAKFEPLEIGAPGDGQALILTGGVSGEAEGGLPVPHRENWQSVDGAPYQRLDWVYDRTVDGNDCAGLHLVEADVAMQAADVLGYQTAADLYAGTLDNSLPACSLFGTAPDDELMLIQGLASFRLLQAQALDGNETAAAATLLALQSGQPDSDYTAASAEWLAEYNASGDPEAACAAVVDIFRANGRLWRITDEYGYNHPALAAGQICFTP